MIFRTLDDRRLMVLHGPNRRGHERPRFFEVQETVATVELKPWDAAAAPIDQ